MQLLPECPGAVPPASPPSHPDCSWRRASGRPAVIVHGSVFCRLVSGNSIEEKLLKNGTKDLIREVAAQGNDYSMAFLTQVPSRARRPRGCYLVFGVGGGGRQRSSTHG